MIAALGAGSTHRRWSIFATTGLMACGAPLVVEPSDDDPIPVDLSVVDPVIASPYISNNSLQNCWARLGSNQAHVLCHWMDTRGMSMLTGLETGESCSVDDAKQLPEYVVPGTPTARRGDVYYACVGGDRGFLQYNLSTGESQYANIECIGVAVDLAGRLLVVPKPGPGYRLYEDFTAAQRGVHRVVPVDFTSLSGLALRRGHILAWNRDEFRIYQASTGKMKKRMRWQLDFGPVGSLTEDGTLVLLVEGPDRSRQMMSMSPSGQLKPWAELPRMRQQWGSGWSCAGDIRL